MIKIWSGFYSDRIRLFFRYKRRKITLSLTKTVAELFIPNPENKTMVVHKDGDPKNNIVSNLYWTNQRKLKTNKSISKYLKQLKRAEIENELKKLYEIDFEFWRPIPNYSNYEASNMGRIRQNTGVIIKEQYHKNWKPRIGITNDNKYRTTKTIPYLVAITFIPNSYRLKNVDNKDGDRTNNKVSNLEWI